MIVTRGSAILVAAALWTSGVARDNPLVLRMEDGTPVENCADPTVIRGQGGNDTSWYMYCTQDALFDGDAFHRLPIFRSDDLVHWTHAGDALAGHPLWAQPSAGLWAPEIDYFRGKYYLYFAVTDTKDFVSNEPGCGSDAAIGVATSSSPTGPFTDSGAPVVYPRRRASGCDFYLTIDPDVIVDASNKKRIYYGNFNGGIETRELSADGFTSDPATAVPVVVADRAEAAEVVQRDGYYYLFASVATCCSGPMSGYSVIVGRSTSPTGPFADREGVSMMSARSGGTMVLGFTGNRWVGPGHNTVFTDLAGQDWTIYHAIDLDEPYFAGSVGYTKRPAFLDPLDWTGGWPSVRGGWWVSDCAQADPVAQAGGTPTYSPTSRPDDTPGALVTAATDDFDGAALAPQWSWIRPPSGGWGLAGGLFRFDTQSAELHLDSDNASVLVEPAPPGDFVVETRMRLSVPAEGGAPRYPQGGLVIYGDDDNYVKLVHVSSGYSRQTEFDKEVFPVVSGYPRFGGTVVGPPADWSWLRIVRRAMFGGERYTAYTSRDGIAWTRGGTWRHALGEGARIGLVSMNTAGFTSEFDYVRTYALAPPVCSDPALADACDVDGDGTGDFCDPDDDGDLLDDVADCAESDATQGRPSEVAQLSLEGASPTTLSWTAAERADVYDVSRGTISALASGDYGACLANDLGGTSHEDGDLPAPGNGFSYLVRAADAGCGGGGSWGVTGAGAERGNANPAACP